jgi:hypothetical protein
MLDRSGREPRQVFFPSDDDVTLERTALSKSLLNLQATIGNRDFGTTTHTLASFIFLLTSFFINSMFQIVATKHCCEFFHENGRENRKQWQPRKRQRRKRSIKKVRTM